MHCQQDQAAPKIVAASSTNTAHPAAHILPTSRPRTHRRKPTPTMATEAATPATQPSLSPTQATTYLTQFIGRNLRIHVTDKRMFIGQMKCTDKASPARLTTTAYH